LPTQIKDFVSMGEAKTYLNQLNQFKSIQLLTNLMKL